MLWDCTFIVIYLYSFPLFISLVLYCAGLAKCFSLPLQNTIKGKIVRSFAFILGCFLLLLLLYVNLSSSMFNKALDY